MKERQQNQERQTAFGYSIYPEKELGFYVVCNDKMILEDINNMMRGKGMVGISDTAGRLHYMVDARTGAAAAAHHISKEVMRTRDDSTLSLSGAWVLQAVEELLATHQMDKNLLGTRIIRFLLLQSLQEPALLTAVSKRLYPLAAQEFGMSVSQIERNLRYALSRTQLYQQGYRNVHIIQTMHDMLTTLLVQHADNQSFPFVSPI